MFNSFGKKSWVPIILVCIFATFCFYNIDYHYQATRLDKQTPTTIIQFGLGGTATTLQFHILCVLMAFLHEDEINNVGCYYARQPAHKYCVIKTHIIKDTLLQLLPPESWIFMTSSSALSSEKKKTLDRQKLKIMNMRIRIPFIVDIETVSQRGHNIVRDYNQFFNISDTQMQHAVEYFRYWDILRLCCGIQMSADWRFHLVLKKPYVPHNNPHSPSYPACEMYNISAVEHLLMKTYVYQHFANVPSLHNTIGKPSRVDGPLDGSYCERCSRNIEANSLKFNENCSN